MVEDSLAVDRLDFRMMAEGFLRSHDDEELRAFLAALEKDVQTLLDVVYDLAWSGLREDAFCLLASSGQEVWCNHPMFWYTLSWLAADLDRDVHARSYIEKAEAISPLYCFPARYSCLRRRAGSFPKVLVENRMRDG
jgi:hypothetical protein